MSYLYDENGHAKYKDDYEPANQYDDLVERDDRMFGDNRWYDPVPVMFTLSLLIVGFTVGMMVNWGWANCM